ncbi:hypothetical protein [Chryseobacterium aurantiacum]|uniref:hypothetical protein n=1 Tax=Chryseobacterium aurantiacum TaxID=2116499 RepID=UPI000D1326C3|nr:hypothetical protein [Chryseobacterium aurantiacum]
MEEKLFHFFIYCKPHERTYYWPKILRQKLFQINHYFGDEGERYDVQYFTNNELISDVPKHYERFLEIISEERNEMFVGSNINEKKN